MDSPFAHEGDEDFVRVVAHAPLARAVPDPASAGGFPFDVADERAVRVMHQGDAGCVGGLRDLKVVGRLTGHG